jgi:hypothetical protein
MEFIVNARNANSIVLFVFLFIFSCSEQQKIQSPKKESVQITLKFSPAHQSYFQDVEKSQYIDSEIGKLFSIMKEKSDTICEMVWGQKNLIPSVLHTYLKPESLSKEPFQKWGHPLPKLIAGCWNFIKMNDTRPDLDFQLVNQLYPTEKKECFSVGFLQPYWMHTILGCEKLTFLDIDWKIHDAHFQLLSLYQQKKMKTESEILESIQSLNLGWIARFDNKPMVKKEKPSFDTLCYSKFQKNCLGFLSRFQEAYLPIKQIDFQVSALHNASYKFLPNTLPVLFFSNAIEGLYTSKSQFNQIMETVTQGLGEGRKAIFIHHAAGQSQFGLYELSVQKEGFQIKTVCKDEYVSSPVGETHAYVTHFENATSSKGNIPSCSQQPVLKSFLKTF